MCVVSGWCFMLLPTCGAFLLVPLVNTGRSSRLVDGPIGGLFRVATGLLVEHASREGGLQDHVLDLFDCPASGGPLLDAVNSCFGTCARHGCVSMLNGGEGFKVEVHRPLHSRSAVAVFKARWGKLQARRARRRSGDELSWLDGAVHLDDLGWVIAAVGAAVMLVFAAPYLVLFLFAALELVVLSFVACAGLFAAVVFRRPYRVVVVDREGGEVASELPVVGLRKARQVARDVEHGLAKGFDPRTAVMFASAE